MEIDQQLKSIIAELLNISEEIVVPELSLDIPKFRSSAGRAILHTAIKYRLGRGVETANVKTYADLLTRVNGKSSSSELNEHTGQALPLPVAAEPGNSNLNGGLSCGIDMEPVATFPECEDYWSHEFYISAFTPDEIAYCVSRTNPRLHFAARWCAKEALKKTSSFYMQLGMVDIQVEKRPDGSVFLQYKNGGAWKTAAANLSLSHTEDYAVAMVTAANGSSVIQQSEITANSERQQPVEFK